MTRLDDSFYLILKPTRRYGAPVNGVRPVAAFSVSKIRRERPFTDRDEIAVKLNLTIDSTLFDIVIPNVDIVLGERDLFVNTRVEISAEEEPNDQQEITP